MTLSDITPGPFEARPPTEDPLMVDVAHYHLSFFPSYIKTIADELLAGKASIVHLQPGDATLYMFYLIPQTEDLRITDRFGYGSNPWEDNRFVWLSPINLGMSGGAVVELRLGGNIFYDLDACYHNEHTKKVLTIFLDLVHQSVSNLPLIPLDCFSKSE